MLKGVKIFWAQALSRYNYKLATKKGHRKTLREVG